MISFLQFSNGESYMSGLFRVEHETQDWVADVLLSLQFEDFCCDYCVKMTFIQLLFSLLRLTCNIDVNVLFSTYISKPVECRFKQLSLLLL